MWLAVGRPAADRAASLAIAKDMVGLVRNAEHISDLVLKGLLEAQTS